MFAAWRKSVKAVPDGRLSTGENYYVRPLGPLEFHLAAELDRRVYESLSEEHRIFFNPHEESWYHEYAELGNKVYGVFLESGKLTAKANLAFGTEKLEPFGIDPKSRTYRNNRPQSLAILSGGAVDPAYQGNGLQKILMKTRLDAAQLAGATQALTTIHVKNIPSIMSALKSGLVLSDMGINPRHNDQVFYFTKPLSPRISAFDEARIPLTHSITNLRGIQAILESGYSGRALLGQETIAFMPHYEAA